MRSPLTLLPLLLLAPAAGAQDLYDESVVREIELTFHQSNWWSQLEANYGTEIEIPADLTMDGVTYLDVGVRFKGNTSYMRPTTQKKSFNVSMDEFVAGQDLLGYSTLNFNNAFMDPTFMREVLFSKACRSFTSAAKGNFIHLKINNENWGIYANVQQLNKDFLEEWYETDTGDRFKVPSALHNPGNASLNWLGNNPANYQQWYELKTSDPAAYDRIRDLCNVVDNTPTGAGYLDAVDQLLNLDRALWTLALENCFMDSDGYVHKGSDYALYLDDVHGRWQLLQRDANEAFGSFSRHSWHTNGTVNLHPGYERGNPDVPLLNKVLNEPEAWERYLAHYRFIMDEWLTSAKVDPIVDTWDGMIRAEVQLDTKKIYSFQDYVTNLTSDVNQGPTVFKGLKQYVNDRRAYLTGLPEFNRPLPQLSDLRHHGTYPAAGAPVTVTVAASAPAGSQLDFVSLHYRDRGAYQEAAMFDDGQHGDGQAGDGVWGAQVPGFPAGTRVQYYVSSGLTAGSGGAWEFLPRSAELNPPSWITQAGNSTTPCINEFLAINSTVLADPSGEYDDCIEILNRDVASVDLGGMHLSDRADNLTKWAFPANTVVPAGETVLVWADEDNGQLGLHASFKLSGSGESLFLTDTDGVTILDAIWFGEQVEDHSTGRLFDGETQWVTFSEPTPGALNEASCGYRPFDQLDAGAHELSLSGVGVPSIGARLDVLIEGAPAGGTVVVAGALGPAENTTLVPPGIVLIDLQQQVNQVSLVANASGEATFGLDLINPSLAGRAFFLQAYAPSTGALSNGLEVVICP
jgi:hypothetical protein